MQKCLVLCVGLLALVLALALADDCPDGGRCERGSTCCKTPIDGYECCPLHQAECCEDHKHCCPAGTTCSVNGATCVNATDSLPWVKRVPAKPSGASKSFRMIKSYSGEQDDNVCPDASRCPPEFTCLKARGGYSCCPLPQGLACQDGKHCCSKNHQCSADSRSCIKKKAQAVTTVICSDKVSECPDGSTCCVNVDGTWGCCPLPQAVCCEDKIHCCPEKTTCDLQQSKCLSSTNQELPMWAKLPARQRAQWENQKEETRVTSAVPRTGQLLTSTLRSEDMVVPCNGTVACPDGSTCCQTLTGEWACCPLVQAVCCQDHQHCCPQGTVCDLATLKCNSPSGPVPMVQKIAAFTTPKPDNVDPHTDSLKTSTASVVLLTKKSRAKDKEVEGRIQCDSHTSCPKQTTCCFMSSSKQWGCCPLPEAVCCSDGDHCCPAHYTCNDSSTSCSKEGVVIPWYNKLAAEEGVSTSASVRCDAKTSCPEGSTCCQLSTGQWGCCPLKEAVCCPDQEHCCPQGYTCNMDSGSCQKLIFLQIQTLPMTRVSVPVTQPQPQPQPRPQPQPQPPPQQPQPTAPQGKVVHCKDGGTCKDGETCCKTSTSWACCPLPDAVCCSDFEHCCPAGFTCEEGGMCTQSPGRRWDDWQGVFSNMKRALVL